MSEAENRCRVLIDAMEVELRRIGLWEQDPPPPAALRSQAPFCYDSLRFHQWLQWVFIPRTRGLLDKGQSLPERSEIYPLAQESLNALNQDTDRLLSLIADFDQLICASSKAGR